LVLSKGAQSWMRCISILVGVLLSFDNLPGLYRISGLYTGAPALPFLLLGILFLRAPKTRSYKVFRAWTFGMLIFGVASSVLSLLAPDVQAALVTVTVNGESVLAKGIKTFIIASTWVLAVRLGYILFLRDSRVLVWVGVGLLAANTVVLVTQITGLTSTGMVDALHAVRWHEDRLRGLKFESSVFGASIIAAAALATLTLRRRSVWVLGLPLVAAMVYLTTSRGALVAIAVGFILSLIFMLLSRTLQPFGHALIITISIIVVLAGSLFGYVFVTSPLWSPLSAAGSDATRSGWGLVALQSLNSTPLGLNVVNYWLEVRQLVAQVNATLQPTFGAFNLVEFSNLVYSDSDSGLSPKTLPAVLGVWFGLPGLIWGTLSLAIGAANASVRRERLIGWHDVFILSTLISLVLFVPGIFIYETALVLGAALSMKFRSDHLIGDYVDTTAEKSS
jgi:hypothetical protein